METKLNSTDPANYQPIARIPLPAKIIEKTINAELSIFFADSQVLGHSQFGFRTNHSTETAFIKTTEEIWSSLDDGGSAVLILLDLSAAFDTVDHALLVH